MNALNYRQRAQLHRPHYAADMAAAIRDLRGQGLMPHDIAAALGISVEAVKKLLAPRAITNLNLAGSAGMQE